MDSHSQELTRQTNPREGDEVAAIKAKIQDALNNGSLIIPDGKKAAFITHLDYSQSLKASAAFAYKISDSWQVGNVLDWSHDEGVKEGLFLQWSH